MKPFVFYLAENISNLLKVANLKVAVYQSVNFRVMFIEYFRILEKNKQEYYRRVHIK